MYDGATYFAWFVLALLFLIAVGFIVWLGSIPKKIAVGRNHPQVDAINACSWIGLGLGGIGWPIAFVWAFLRSGHAGYESTPTTTDGAPDHDGARDHAAEIKELKMKISDLEEQLRKANTKEQPA